MNINNDIINKQNSLYPLSYKEWIDVYKGPAAGEEYRLYNQYLIDWYKDNRLQNTNDEQYNLKVNYLFLLKQLQSFFSRKEIENWYANIDLNNEKELLLAIPYFAKKLKEISFYYLKLRNEIKESQTKYKIVGTPAGIKQQIQEYLLTNYTKKPDYIQTIPADVWNQIPELSSITEPLKIEIEELYDLFNYMDHSYSMPVSAYYNLNDENTQEFFKSLNLNLQNDSWIYSTGVFENILKDEVIDNINVSEIILQKYTGTNRFTFLQPLTTSNLEVFDIPIETGNNFFYWPYGPYEQNVKNLTLFEPIPLSSINLTPEATGSPDLSSADTIFIKTKSGIKGSWLRKKLYNEFTTDMSSLLKRNDTTQFRFPFPGFGLSADDITWTGFSLSSDPRYFYLSDEYKKAINNVYWTTSFNLTSVKPIPINSTSLIQNKAYANTNYKFADKIRIWPEPPSFTDPSYAGVISEAWLHRIDNTNISIAENTDNTIIWPLLKIDSDEDYPVNLPNNLNTFCGPVLLKNIEFPYAVASNHISGADVIYKINNFKESKNDAVTCAWLSGIEMLYPETGIKTVLQPGLFLNLQPGTYTKFIWQGPDNTNANEVFKSYSHQSNCNYITQNVTYKDHLKCNCKQVLFTPFGHPGTDYTDNYGLADFIVEDLYYTDKIDLDTWRHVISRTLPGFEWYPPIITPLTYRQSPVFAWYKTDNKIGWGEGSWQAGTYDRGEDTSFNLRTGHTYIYYRANIKDEDAELAPLPPYIIRHQYENFNSDNFVWITGEINTEQIWESTDMQSDMSLLPGNHYIYSRQDVTNFALTGTTIEILDLLENRNNTPWTSYDFLTIGEDDKQFLLSFPNLDSVTEQQLDSGYIPNLGNNFLLDVISWTVVFTPTNTSLAPVTRTYRSQSVAITPSKPGVYSFSVTYRTSTINPPLILSSVSGTFFYLNTASNTFNNIPQVTAIDTISLVPSLTTFNSPAPGFVLNTPLFGWDYNLNEPTTLNTENQGARPFWAKSYFTENEIINFPRIDTLGTSLRLIDEHNFISQPEISDITLQAGQYFEYERNYNTDLVWNQTIDILLSTDENIWSDIDIDTDISYTLQEVIQTNTINTITTPTLKPTTLVLQTFVDNEPVEVFYNANSPFTWSITATPLLLETFYSDLSVDKQINAISPTENLTNRYYPNVAVLPTLQSLSTVSDIGGYFTPSHLGVLQYFDRNYTTSVSSSNIELAKTYEDKNEYISGIGATKQQQPTPFVNLKEDSTWLKEPAITGALAGTIKKSIFKKYPKFIPYQSTFESNSQSKLGLVTNDSLQSPWTGPQSLDWGDEITKPVSFTGQINVDRWAEQQILKNTNLQLENWCTDIYNNQYGLYKPTKISNLTDKKNIAGEIWVRKNSQKVLQGNLALSGVFDTYINSNIINELTGQGILTIETYFDTLYIQTSGAIIFEKIIYDYNTDNIFSLVNDARIITLGLPTQTNLDKLFCVSAINCPVMTYAKAGETWFFPESKNLIQSIVGLSGNHLHVELYKINVNTLDLQKIFPNIENDVNLFTSLSTLSLQNIEPPLLTYNTDNKTYTLLINGANDQDEKIIIDIKILDSNNFLTVKDVVIYTPTPKDLILDPPILINESIHIVQKGPAPFQFQLDAVNGPVTFTSMSWPSNFQLTDTGLIRGFPEGPGFYTLPFYITNNIGSTYYAFTIFVGEDISTSDRILLREIQTDAFNVSAIATDTEPLTSLLVTD